jgi:hypothetical protein
MKIYKTHLFISLIIIPGITYLIFLYKQDRLIILYKNNSSQKANLFNFCENKINGMIYHHTSQETIPLSINYETFNKESPDTFLYNALYQYFHFLNLNNIGKYSYTLHHIAIKNKTLIINGALYCTIPLSPHQEHLLLKSIFHTVIEIVPYIESIYFYDDEKPLPLHHLLPFITKKIFHNKKIIPQSTVDPVAKPLITTIIPYFEGNGNTIDKIFEKNFFQKDTDNIYIPKNKQLSHLYFKEINQLHAEHPNQIIIYVTLREDQEERIDIINFPILSPDDNIKTIIQYPQLIQSDVINKLEETCNNKLAFCHFYTYPFIPLLNTVYPSLYVIISGNNREKITNTITQLKTLFL